MCGILIYRDEPDTLYPSKISLLVHRGIETNIVDLGGMKGLHTRLPIQTSLNDDWSQPYQISESRWLFYNGEIFDYPDHYENDVEYLVDTIRSRGISGLTDDLITRDGFWAIVISDGGNSVLHCITDPLGKKQLYYNRKGEICSEIKPLIGDSEFDGFYKSSVFKWGYSTNDRTPWEEVKKLSPGYHHIFQDGKLVDSEQYFHWRKVDLVKDLKQEIEKSVRSRITHSKVKIGLLLSGGLDSSIIAYECLKERGDRKDQIAFYTAENGENEFVELLKNEWDINVRKMASDGFIPMDSCLYHNETPVDLGSLIPQHSLFGMVPETVVLTGDGADELFGGYRRINDYDSQLSDIFEELTFYHLPRLDRASMRFTIELRNPFLSHKIIRYALSLPYPERQNKKILKDLYRGLIPDEIIDREKKPLKIESLLQDPLEHRKQIFNTFYSLNWKNL